MKHTDLLKKKFRNRTVLIAAHQGLGGGNIVLNTPNAMENAIRFGADILEIDVSRSFDGEYFVFHQDLEPRHLKVMKRIDQMTAAQIKELFLWNNAMVESIFRVSTFDEMMAIFKGREVLINVDKCDLLDGELFDKLASYGMEDQLIIKGKSERGFLDTVANHGTDFMFMPLVNNKEDVDLALSLDGLNVVGFEVIFSDISQPHVQKAYLESLKNKGYFLWVNAISLGKRFCLSADIDDDLSMLDHPDKGWGKLISMGFNVLQTDWTPMLNDYLGDMSL